jgi:proteasome lid subunit RPN8/RPN11
MKTTDHTDNTETVAAAPRVEFSSEVLRQVRQHARSSMSAEICGVLLGTSSDGATRVTARIEGVGAVEAGTNVTFTQETWGHIFRVKDAQHPELSIVGWYHSHPGFGVFLSEYDIFIHENFFSGAHQVAWVFDPHSDEEGCFGWVGKNVKPLARVSIRQNLRGQADGADAAPVAPRPAKNGREEPVQVAPGRPRLAIGLFLLAWTVASLTVGALLRPSLEKLAPQAWQWIRPASSAAPVPATAVLAPPPASSAQVPPLAAPPTAVPTPEMRRSAPVPGGEKSAPSPAPPAARKKG